MNSAGLHSTTKADPVFNNYTIDIYLIWFTISESIEGSFERAYERTAKEWLRTRRWTPRSEHAALSTRVATTRGASVAREGGRSEGGTPAAGRGGVRPPYCGSGRRGRTCGRSPARPLTARLSPPRTGTLGARNARGEESDARPPPVARLASSRYIHANLLHRSDATSTNICTRSATARLRPLRPLHPCAPSPRAPTRYLGAARNCAEFAFAHSTFKRWNCATAHTKTLH